MSNMIRTYKRNIIKNELETNDIKDSFHDRYGYHSQKTKTELKIEKAIEKKKLKLARKKARRNRISKLFGGKNND